MFKVICPNCKNLREVKAKKQWMTGEEPYSCLCKTCCQINKLKTQEHKDKISKSVSDYNTEEIRKQKSDFMKEHPELWENNLHPELGPLAKKGMKLTDEQKENISKGILNKKEKE
jgi:hypothetical protein